MKKKTPEFKLVKGWNLLTDSRGFCTGCGALISIGMPMYWRKDKDRAITRCPECVEPVEGK